MGILSVYTLLKVVDLSVLSMSVMGFPKTIDGGGWVGRVLSNFLGFLKQFSLCKAPKVSFDHYVDTQVVTSYCVENVIIIVVVDSSSS